jgi:hypothetical protein
MLRAGHANEFRALATAPLAIFPVALVFILVRSFIAGDLRELFVAPISAAMITIIGYPLAFAVGWSLLWALKRFTYISSIFVIVTAVISAEVVFWGLISPFWQREFSIAFCIALVGTCGLSCGCMFLWLSQRQEPN